MNMFMHWLLRKLVRKLLGTRSGITKLYSLIRNETRVYYAEDNTATVDAHLREWFEVSAGQEVTTAEFRKALQDCEEKFGGNELPYSVKCILGRR